MCGRVFCLGSMPYKGEDEVCGFVFCLGSMPYKGEDEVCVFSCRPQQTQGIRNAVT